VTVRKRDRKRAQQLQGLGDEQGDTGDAGAMADAYYPESSSDEAEDQVSI
jgi:hypothetical protein